MATGGEEGISVLHVDDEPGFADLAAQFLERADDRFGVETAASASEGLEYLAEHDVDCIVSDYDIPGQNGIELLETVREEYPDLPFILFTGKGSEEVASEAISMDVTDYLQKETGTEQYKLLANRILNAVDQVRADRRAKKHHRINTVVRRINEALARATTRRDIDEAVCRIISETEPYRFAWIGEHDPETRIVKPREAAGIGDDYLDTIEITTNESPTGRGPTGRAVRNRELVVMQNIPENPQYEPWREQAIERGYRSSAAVPFVFDDTLYGVLNVYADRTHAFDDHERRLLSSLGETIAHAFHRIELQRQYTDQYRTLFEDAPVMVVFTRAEGDEPIIEDCNQAFANRLGYTREELRNTPLAEYYTDESAEELLGNDGYRRALAGDFVREQRTLVTRDDDEVLTILSASPRQNRDGEIVGTHALFLDITDQRQVTELRQIRDRMEFALEATDSIIYEIDIETGQETRHGSVEQLYGLPSDHVPTKAEFYEAAVHPEDRSRLEDALRAVEREGDGRDVEFRTHPENGPVRWIRTRAYLEDTEGSDSQSLVGLDTDITDHVDRTRELERTNALLSTLFDTLPQGVLAEDESREVLAINQRMFDLFEMPGVPEDVVGADCELLAENVNEMFVEPEKFVDRINGLVSERDAVDNEELTLTDGRTFERSYRPIELPDGDGSLWVYADVTERTEYQRRIQQLQVRTQNLIERRGETGIATKAVEIADEALGFSLSGIHLVDDDRERLEPVAVTDAIRVHLGGEPVYERTDPSRQIDSYNWSVFERGEPVVIQDTQDHEGISFEDTPSRSGVIHPLGDHGLLITSSPEPYGFDENDVHLVEILATIVTTVLDRAEREAELRDQKHRLEEKTERLDQFASVVSHDLRNPLNVAEGNLELARKKCDSEYLDEVAWAHERMRTLTDELLTLAREGKDVTAHEPIDLATLVENCWENVATADATLVVDVDRTARGDQSRLKQLFENLYRNAIEHGGEDVTVTVGGLDDGFYIEDDGSGIPEDDFDDVFEVGYSSTEAGTGLGLAIVEEIIEVHDWEITIVEGSECGARFEITGVEFLA